MTEESIDADGLRELESVVEFLGGSLVSDGGPGDLAIEREGRTVAFVRSSELHGALDRMTDGVEREFGAEMSCMDRAQKQAAVRLLDEQGAFLLRGAVDRVARSMGVSRVTLYSYLNALERRA